MKTPQEIIFYIKESKKTSNTFILGIDGPGGSGKTTLSSVLKQLDSTIQVVHIDDFDLPSNGKIIGNPLKKKIGADTDWERLKNEVILPLRSNKRASFLPFDREVSEFGSRCFIDPGGIVIVEGVFSIRKELFMYYDLTIWLILDTDSRLKRVIKRDGERMRERWEKDWLPMEDRYVSSHHPEKYAHLIFDSDLLLRDISI